MGIAKWMATISGLMIISACEQGRPLSVPVLGPEFQEGSVGYAVVEIANLGPQRVQYVVKNGLAIYSGDLILSPEQLSGLADPRTTSTGRSSQTYKWPGGLIPYQIDRSKIPEGGAMDVTIQNAMTAWRSATPIKFGPYSGIGDYMYITVNTSIVSSAGASTSVGRAGATQHTVYLAPDIGACECVGGVCKSCVGVPTHEIGHIIGLYHEQQRADRDQYILVYDGLSPAGCTPGNCLASHFFSCANGSACNNGACAVGGACCNPNNGDFLRYSDEAVGAFGNDGVALGPRLDLGSIVMYGDNGGGCCGTPRSQQTIWRPRSVDASRRAIRI